MGSTIVIDAKNTDQTFKIAKDERKTFIIILGYKYNQRLNMKVELNGEGAEAQILGIIVGKKKDSIKLNTLQKHTAPNTTSDLLVRGVFLEKSQFQYRGLIEIAKDAQNANSFQQEDNLVLSSNVNIDTRPELEIEANEVRCTHAATVAPIDKEQIYYMRTRGLSEEKTKELIIEGFLNEVIGRVYNIGVKKKLEKKVKQLLAG